MKISAELQIVRVICYLIEKKKVFFSLNSFLQSLN